MTTSGLDKQVNPNPEKLRQSPCLFLADCPGSTENLRDPPLRPNHRPQVTRFLACAFQQVRDHLMRIALCNRIGTRLKVMDESGQKSEQCVFLRRQVILALAQQRFNESQATARSRFRTQSQWFPIFSVLFPMLQSSQSLKPNRIQIIRPAPAEPHVHLLHLRQVRHTATHLRQIH